MYTLFIFILFQFSVLNKSSYAVVNSFGDNDTINAIPLSHSSAHLDGFMHNAISIILATGKELTKNSSLVIIVSPPVNLFIPGALTRLFRWHLQQVTR